MSIQSLMIASTPAKSSDTGTFQVLGKIGRAKLDKKVVQVSGVRGTQGVGVQFTIQNVGTAYLRFGTDAFSFSGPDASQFTIVGSPLPRNIAPGKRGTFYVALKAGSSASVTRVLTATLNIKQTGASSAIAAVSLRGLATTGEGGDKEPSLARILDLFQYTINDGDTSPDTTFLDLNGGPTDEIVAPRFTKAGTGDVQINMLAQYANRTTTYAGRIGTYDPGTPDSRTQLFSLTGIDSQTVNPVPNGPSSFDPGSKEFSLWAEAPTFIDNSQSRVIYGEPSLNTWEPTVANRDKVRVYPLKVGGKVVANSYVVAFEEYTVQNDQNDYVFVLSNVKVAAAQPEIGFVQQADQVESDHLSFNRIETPDPDITNTVHDNSKVRIINTGNKPLVISAITLSGSSNTFQITNAPSLPFTLAAGSTFDLNVKFVATSGDIHTGSIAIASNDADEPTKTVALSGFWQSNSENNSQGISQEPTLEEIFEVMGYRVSATNGTQSINTHGATQAVGDEVLSDHWAAADASKPVTVQDIASFHEQGDTDQVGWYLTGHPYYGASDPRNPGSSNGDKNQLFQNTVADGQSLFPHANGSSTDYEIASFKPGTGTFGLRVNGEFSDDSLNTQASGDQGGHHFRFYPVRDSDGNYVPDTWLVTMDFASINFDYNDHLLLVRNMKPAALPASVNSLTGEGTSAGGLLDWADVPGAAGYAVYRATKASGPFERITDDLLTTSYFTDTSLGKGKARYYRIVALDSAGHAGMPANVRVARA